MKTRIIYSLLAGLFFSLYWLTWKGAMLFVVIIGVFLWLWLINYLLRHHSRRITDWLGVVCLFVGIDVIAVVFYRYIPTLFTGQTALATMELESANILLATHSFSVLTFLIPVILVLLVYQVAKRGEASTILLLVWSVAILVITLVYWRFAYYFAVNVALLTGWFVWYTWQKLIKQDRLRAVLVVGVLCAVAVIPNFQQATANKNYHTPSDAWCDTLTWVKNNTPEGSVILSWWDYGYWISRIADRKAYITPAQQANPVAGTARFFLSHGGETSIDHTYLILDYPATTSKFRAITIWADLPIEKYSPEYYQSLVVRLYQGEPVGQYALVYESKQEIEGIAEVKVFYKRKIIDGQ